MTPDLGSELPASDRQPVVVVGAGPVGCTAALLLADFGVRVTLLERHPSPPSMPRAVHLDDEAARILGQIGLAEEFLARSRSCSGLRLLDAEHRVMAEFRRANEIGEHGFPQANMFHQPELEELMYARVATHPLITLHRGAEVVGLDGTKGLSSQPVRVRTVLADGGSAQTFTGSLVLGCDGAGSTVRDLAGITMRDLGFTERWLVVDVRAAAALDTWDGVDQVCDPARAATFMQVTRDRYRWEFQLRDGEDAASLSTPQALGRLLQPWTGRSDLAGLEVIRSASYTFRAQVARRLQAGRIFLLGDAAHLTPPFIGQGLAAGLRDADNLAWKIAHVLTGQAGEELLGTYHTERRPHAEAMVKRAVRIGWAMTGGQGRAAAVRRAALAAAVRSARVRESIVSTATPRIKAGALQRATRLPVPPVPAGLRTGGQVPNPMVSTGAGPLVRLDAVLGGRTAVLTAREPGDQLSDLCRRHQLLMIMVGAAAGPRNGELDADPRPAERDLMRIWLPDDVGSTGLSGLVRDPALTILVRPDRVIASLTTRSRLPRLPWSSRAAAQSTGLAEHLSPADDIRPVP
jgi:3-(3-hydroxy-phenyl)propionate hydroxylase